MQGREKIVSMLSCGNTAHYDISSLALPKMFLGAGSVKLLQDSLHYELMYDCGTLYQ